MPEPARTRRGATRGRVFGPETWLDDGEVNWSHWDLWFCLVWAADFAEDRDRFTDELHQRHDGPFGCPDWESFVSHLDDLGVRLEKRGLSPAAIAGDALFDKQLLVKARRKVLERGLSTNCLTQPMIDTPRARLCRRALRGRWDDFSVSPEAAYEEFAVHLARRAADRSRRYGLVRPFIRTLERLDRRCGDDPARSLAVFRAFLTAGIEAMDRNLGSQGVVEMISENLFRYVALPWQDTGLAAESYFADLCELLVWEQYAITFERETEPFRHIRAEQGDLVEGLLWTLEEEYRGHGLRHHSARALECVAYLAVTLHRFRSMVPAAEALGPNGWVAVQAMAECALAGGRRDLARAAFAAADRPGLLRDNLHRATAEVLGEEPGHRPPLRLIR